MLNEDYRDILQSLADEQAKFLLVGAYALAAHGYPSSFTMRQQDAPTQVITLEGKSGDRILIGIAPSGGMQPEEMLSGITIPAFRRGRSLRKADGPLAEQQVTRTILGVKSKGAQFAETLPSALLCSEFHAFTLGNRLYLVSLQWKGNTVTNLPTEIRMVMESMKESNPQPVHAGDGSTGACCATCAPGMAHD